MIKALKNRNMPMDKAQILCLLQDSQQYEVFSYGSSDEVEVWLVPRDDCPDHLFLKVYVAFGRLNGCVTHGAGVVFDMRVIAVLTSLSSDVGNC